MSHINISTSLQFHTSFTMSFSDQHSPAKISSIQLRVLVAVPESGSTLLMRSFAQNAACLVASQLISQGNRSIKSPFKPDYSISGSSHLNEVYTEALERKCSTLITDEELGRDEGEGKSDFDGLSLTTLHESTKPASLFRDPLRVYDSWKALGGDQMSSFLTVYRDLARMWSESLESTSCVYEELARNQELTLKRLCKYWDLDFTDNMLVLNQHDALIPGTKSHQPLTKSEIDLIETQLTPLYLSAYGSSIHDLTASLHAHSWYAFDLDDTLHAFRKASSAAASEVFTHISNHSAIPTTSLATSYSAILAQKTSSAFTDGRTSDDYRKERSGALLQKHDLEADENRLVVFAGLYKDTLANALETKAGALSLLSYHRSIGKKIAIVTEGPQDAQQWTIEKLGLAEYVDVLVTTNKFGVSKTEGLFEKVLDSLGIEGRDIVYVGDNYARDIVPAQEQKITTVHFSEDDGVVLSLQGMRVNSLLKIENVLRSGQGKAKVG